MAGTVIAMLNQKGGVGKSSTCHHLAGALASRGRRVLLVDNDPQSSLTQGFIGPKAMHALDPDFTVAGFYGGTGWLQSSALKVADGIDLVPGSPQVKVYNDQEPASCPPEHQHGLDELAAEARAEYDFILVDCPPNLHLCSWAALSASDGMIVPLKPEDYGAQGVSDVNDSFDAAKAVMNPGLENLGYLLTLVDYRKGIHAAYEAAMRETYGSLVFDAVIRDRVDYVESLNRHMTAQRYKPKGDAAAAMRSLADEVERRVAAVRPREGAAR